MNKKKKKLSDLSPYEQYILNNCSNREIRVLMGAEGIKLFNELVTKKYNEQIYTSEISNRK